MTDGRIAPSPGPRARLAPLLRLAWRESRTARRRLLLYMSSIALGVAALVAIDSFSGNVTRSVRSQSRSLLGGDVAFVARSGSFPARVDTLLDSIATAGTPVARVTSFASMGVIPRTQGTRLVQVRAVSPGYPFYGTITTQPAGRWAGLHAGAHALVDPSLLVALDAQVGDSLVLGYGRFEITGTLDEVPGDPGIAAVIGPRVFIPARYLAETQLLVFGSRAEYEALVKLPPSVSATSFLQPLRSRIDSSKVRIRTVADTERRMTRAVDRLGDFLSIVGLIALLLGGVGVASGVSAFVARKIDTVAVLRCLGATSAQVLVIFVVQAALMGLLGASAGALLGVGIQFLLPRAVGEFLPLEVDLQLEPAAIALGLGVGLWVALVFALRPLIALRRVSPLQALRRDVDPAALRSTWRDWPRLLVDLALVASIVVIAISRTGVRDGLALSAGIAGVLLVLWLSAGLLSAVARRAVRAGWPYVVRQGVANLYRPANQTRSVVLSLGFGAFLVSTIYLVQTNLLREFDVNTDASRANVLFFDVQEDQAADVSAIVRAQGHAIVQETPIVTMRIAEVNGRTVAQLLGDTARVGESWPLRREFRSTYRSTLVSSERLTAGRWFTDTGAVLAPGTIGEVSFEQEVGRELNVALGDTVVWDVQGVRVPTRVTSFREVNWARFEPNFFAVLTPASLAPAPKQFVILTNVPTPAGIAQLQRAVVNRHPNVSSVDLSLIQRTVGEVVRKVSLAVRFLAVFSLAMGIPVLFSAVSSTRRDRLREGVLLKTLGATRAQIRNILLAEYALLGLLGALTGMLLSFVGAWGLTHFVFEGTFRPAYVPALSIAAGMSLLTLLIGGLTGRDVFRETPMAALRDA
jgi:putative ABC transport system permease protein